MSQYTALLDANMLYPASLRDILLQLAVTDIFRAKWTADIHEKWIETLLRDRPDLDCARLERTRDLMDTNLRDCLVTGYRALIPSLELPDPDDRHVLAAVIVGRCDVVVTRNTKHFPPSALAPYDIETQPPNTFLHNHLDLFPETFCEAARKVRARLKNPELSVEQYLEKLEDQGLKKTVAELKTFSHLL